MPREKKGTREQRMFDYTLKNLNLNPEQTDTREKIINNAVTIISGKAGSGKTLVAIATGIELLMRGDVDQIVITRPTVSTENIGFLPGDIKEKMDPWLAPIYDNIERLIGNEGLDKIQKEGKIAIVPAQFMRGRTFYRKYVLVDECQNLTVDQTMMILTRIGKHGKIVFCGDTDQIDLMRKSMSGLAFLTTTFCVIKRPELEGELVCVQLYENHRHPIVDKILNIVNATGQAMAS